MFLAGTVVAAGAAGFYFWADRALDRRKGYIPPAEKGAGPSAQAARERLREALQTTDRTRRLNEQGGLALRNGAPEDPTAHVRRTLQTIEDINRINRMNREQQGRRPPSSPPAAPKNPQ